MSTQYAKSHPVDRNGTAMTEYSYPASTLGALHRENAATSSVTSFNANATQIEVAAVGMGAGIRWAVNQASSIVTDAGTANFDHFIPAGSVRKFVIPRESQAIPNYNSQGSPSVVGLNTSEGLFSAIATKSVGIGSVLLTQY